MNSTRISVAIGLSTKKLHEVKTLGDAVGCWPFCYHLRWRSVEILSITDMVKSLLIIVICDLLYDSLKLRGKLKITMLNLKQMTASNQG